MSRAAGRIARLEAIRAARASPGREPDVALEAVKAIPEGRRALGRIGALRQEHGLASSVGVHSVPGGREAIGELRALYAAAAGDLAKIKNDDGLGVTPSQGGQA